MDNIYIDVYIPGINKSFDIVAAPDLTVAAAAKYISETIREYEELDESSVPSILCSRSQKKVLDGSLTLYECDIKDGSKLILV